MSWSLNTIRTVLKSGLFLVLLVLLPGCSSSHRMASDNQTNAPTVSQTAELLSKNAQALSGLMSPEETEKLLKKHEVKSKILSHYSDWKGVRYRLGGLTKKGVDCSGFVQIAFREKFGLTLPRTTSALGQIGTQIPTKQLKTGDLVLFDINARTKHVGIYIGNQRFVHASTSRGVMISNLNETYWAKRYKQARRVLTPTNLTNLT